MKAIQYHCSGDVSVIVLGEVNDPKRKTGQLLIGIKAFALNRADLLQRNGNYPPPPGESDIPGLEASGIVLEADAHSHFKPGDRVMTLLAAGGYAEKVAVDERLAMVMPESLSFEEAAAIPEAFLTAHHNLFTLGGVQTHERVLIHAGASGVGTAGIQLLAYQRAQIFATVGSKEKADFLEKQWPVKAIQYKVGDFAEVILEATSHKGVNLILDCVGASYFAQNLKALSLEGRLVCIGTMGGAKGEIDFRLILGKRARIIGSTLRALPIDSKANVVSRFHDQFGRALAEGKIRPVIHATLPAREVAKAQKMMETNQNTGKIILTWS